MTAEDFLKKIVSIYSPSDREEEVARFIAQAGKELGFPEARVDHFNNAILKIGPVKAKKTVVLLGHIDTVKPFLPVKIKEGRLYGRGAVDAKGPFATFVFAALAAAPKLQNIRLVVAGASGEEKSGTGAQVLAEKFLNNKPDAVIVGEPSGWQGITLGYKGVFIIEFFKRKDSMHSANDSEQNVIEEAIELVDDIRKFCAEFNQGKSVWDGLQQRVEKFYFDEISGVEQVKARIRFRTPIGFDNTALKKVVGAASNGGEISYLHSWGSEEACLAPKNTPVVRAFLKSIRGSGGKPVFKVKTGTADMNTFMKAFPKVPMVSYGPGDSNLDHSTKEHIVLEEFNKAVQILAQVLVELDQSL